MKLKNFRDYIDYLKDNLESLQIYEAMIGRIDPDVFSVNKALSDADPFVVFHATIAASQILNDKQNYH